MQFTLALRLDAKNVDALSGAGSATFNLGDYIKARSYLEAAAANGSKSAEVTALLETTKLVSSRDPLAPGIGAQERIRRLIGDLNFASEGLQSCIAKKQDDQSSLAVLEPLRTEIDQDMEVQFRPQALRRDADGFRTGLNLIQQN